ncbi:MAG: hypothetical protein KZQ85_11160 [Candidatus Thiodiazotropha sp. (ex Myrtea sp. 'scaly one' KF741663)]|nr:hypothetical protein [Candidatus Thiodiazotropha sp. (ex Myrtea sp. 'scaly one' KF741663)]
MLNLEQVLTQRFPGFFDSQPRILTQPMLTLMRMLFHEREVNRFLEVNHGVRGRWITPGKGWVPISIIILRFAISSGRSVSVPAIHVLQEI